MGESKNEYKDTLHLPKTDFEMRANLATKEPIMVQRWDSEGLYNAIQKARATAPLFVLHDGPPYANGTLHHGHILNKVLKDIVVRDRTMAGSRAPYIPGWDCHGLPIEVQVDKELGARKASMSKAEIHAACRDYANRFVQIQRDGFKRLGVLGRWDNPYLTMHPAYEAATVREFARFVRSGLVYKGLRPVNWCLVHQTALAEAEVEYDNHRSPSVYVAFPVVENPKQVALPKDTDLAIWTTTPWTLPANMAIAVHPDFDYVAYPVKGRPRLMARALAPAFLQAVGAPAFDEKKILGTYKGRELEGLSYRHPLFPRTSPVILGEHVTTEAGTGCVHTAPAHGPEDFAVAQQYKLEVLSPVDNRGVLTQAAGPFAGMQVFEANKPIAAALQACGALLNDPNDSIEHRYAHCWRCHKPIILRATEQWFVAMDNPYGNGASLRERSLTALGEVQWIPTWGEDRIRGMLAARPDWCLSRQRTWGVPIPVVYCEGCHAPFVSPDHMDKVADVIGEKGAGAWFELPVDALFGAISCASCGGKHFRKENDILDVWFDSGVSFAAVVEEENLSPNGPVDLYLEGSDQHRGWFHSSLLCSLATRQRPPYRAVLTHGFVVDGQGKKISKSKGNYVDPFKAIEKDGAELLRLWVASEDYRDDVRLSQEILTRLSDSYRKVRNTLRYLLGNLSDFDPRTDLVAPDKLLNVDRYALALGQRATQKARSGYDAYAFHQVMQTLVELCTVDLSAFYLDMLKDRLYAAKKTGPERRSAQTTLYILARDLLRLLAPVFCFTAEEAWQYLPKLAGDPQSVHLALYPGVGDPKTLQTLHAHVAKDAAQLLERYEDVRDIRRQVNHKLEEARRAKLIGSSSEAAVILRGPTALVEKLSAFSPSHWADMLIVSKVQWEAAGTALAVEVARAPGTKCARCWLYREEVGAAKAHPALCARCVEAL